MGNFMMAHSSQPAKQQTNSYLREAKKSLIATLPKLKLALTHSKYKTLPFPNRNKNAFLQLGFSTISSNSELQPCRPVLAINAQLP
jgi:hypothetical protein